MLRLRSLAPAVLLALSAGSPSASASSYGIIRTHTGFALLFSLAVDAQGNLYTADQKRFQVVKLSPSGHLLRSFPMPRQCGVSGVAVASSGDVYAVANCQGYVYRFSPAGHLLARFGRFAQGPDANGVAADRQGRVYVAYGNPPGQPVTRPPPGRAPPPPPTSSRIGEFTADGRLTRTVSVQGVGEAFGIAVDRGGNVYLTGLQGLVKVSPAGHVLGRWSQAAPGPNVLPGQPAVDGQGDVYTPNGLGEIIEISAGGRLLGRIIRHGSAPGSVQQPVGVAIGGGHLFVADAGPNRIKGFTLSGGLLAIWTP
ncbi:MAG TPA: NHL repeat-containing protein [Chloroflexota bacterium]